MYSKSSFSVTNFAKEIPHYEYEKTNFLNKGVTYVTEWGCTNVKIQGWRTRVGQVGHGLPNIFRFYSFKTC